MSKLSGTDFDAMVGKGAFDAMGPRKIELIRGELRFMNPAGPIHDDHIIYLTRWSHENTTANDASISVQCGFACDDNRPEPDVLWLKPRRYGRMRPTASDVLLLIEVSDSSLATDLQEKADVYAEGGVAEYWVVDVVGARIHVMSQSDGTRYRDISIVTSPNSHAPQCRPPAVLNTSELFDVRDE